MNWRSRHWLWLLLAASYALMVWEVAVLEKRYLLPVYGLGLLLLAVIGLILALARPQWGFDWEPTKQRGLDIIVAIDTSRSMLADDLKPNRLERAKLEALSLMGRAKTDRLGSHALQTVANHLERNVLLAALIQELVQHARDYVALLREHIQKEDNVLFPMADRVVPVDVADQVIPGRFWLEGAFTCFHQPIDRISIIVFTGRNPQVT